MTGSQRPGRDLARVGSIEHYLPHKCRPPLWRREHKEAVGLMKQRLSACVVRNAPLLEKRTTELRVDEGGSAG